MITMITVLVTQVKTNRLYDVDLFKLTLAACDVGLFKPTLAAAPLPPTTRRQYKSDQNCVTTRSYTDVLVRLNYFFLASCGLTIVDIIYTTLNNVDDDDDDHDDDDDEDDDDDRSQ